MSKKNEHAVDYSQKVLEVKNLKKHFTVGTGKNKLIVPAVDDVSFDVYKREVFGLVGESGCGKTTTGRTIIKLYTPTDGSTQLNGITVGAGYQSNKIEIKRLKKEKKDRINSLDPYKKQIIEINKDKDFKLDLLQQELNNLALEEKAKIKDAKHELEEYKKEVYNRKSQYVLDLEKVNYNYHLDKAEVLENTKNPVEREYRHELKIAKNTFEHKLEGLKESAALKKEVIEKRSAELQIIYDETLVELKTKFEPLIEQAEKDKISKAEAKEQIAKLKDQKNQDIARIKADYVKEVETFKSPDEEKVKEKIERIKADYKQKVINKKAEIAKVKADAKEKINAIPKSESIDKSNPEVKAKIEAINHEINEQIEQQKDMIRNVKETNKSKEALDTSRKMQMIFQDPISSLNPRMTVREIVGEGLTILGGYTKEEIEEKVAEALELVGLAPEYAARYPHEFSGGQRQRIGIARALIMNPNFIIADEPISSLDVSIRAQVINLLSELRERLGLTILFIAHDLSVVRFFCDRIAVMYYGKIVELASSEELFKNPMHPYTISLLSAIPQPDPDYEKGRKRINYDPSMHDYRIDKPTLREVADGHMVYVNDKEFEELKKKYKKANQEVKA